MKPPGKSQQVKFWRSHGLWDLEALHGSYPVCAFPWHLHEEFILGVMVQGTEGLWHRGTRYLAPPGSVIAIEPGEWHTNFSVDESGFAYRTLYPCPALVRHLMVSIFEDEKEPHFQKPIVESDHLLREEVLRLHRALENDHPLLEQESLLHGCLSLLVRRYALDRPRETRVGTEPEYVRRARDYLEANPQENISLSDLGALVGISPFRLLRVFQAQVGVSPFQYQAQVRITLAKRLLRKRHPLVQVALETGFSDQSHLTRRFKQIVGVTPGQYVRGTR